ncbi:MAG: hypothetical protein ACFFC3_14520 [Candidatus Odinarchaeota archaeon]
MSEIFYEIKDIKNNFNLNNNLNQEIVLHFLAKVSNTLILYETKQIIPKTNDPKAWEEIIKSLNNIFIQVDSSLKLIKGKIREIFLSYSS